MSLSVPGVAGKTFLSLTSKDCKVTLAFSANLGQLRKPLEPLALKLWLLDLQLLNLQLLNLHLLDPQLLAGPPAPCRIFSSLPDLQLLDLQLLDFQLLDLQLMDLVPYGSTKADQPSKRCTDYGQTSTNPATAPLFLLCQQF